MDTEDAERPTTTERANNAKGLIFKEVQLEVKQGSMQLLRLNHLQLSVSYPSYPKNK